MNTATQNLENDHVFILRLTDVMMAMVERECTNTEHIDLVVNLVRNYADGLHHAKEEHLLFPLMLTKGFSSEQGPIALMLSEHDLGRTYIGQVASNNILLKGGSTGVLSRIYYNLAGYVNLLRNHIAKENKVLFRMADQVFSFEEQQQLLAQFAEVEAKTEEEYNSANSIHKINDLAAIYLQ